MFYYVLTVHLILISQLLCGLSLETVSYLCKLKSAEMRTAKYSYCCFSAFVFPRAVFNDDDDHLWGKQNDFSCKEFFYHELWRQHFDIFLFGDAPLVGERSSKWLNFLVESFTPYYFYLITITSFRLHFCNTLIFLIVFFKKHAQHNWSSILLWKIFLP